MYQSIYRKYRPQTFMEIYGQDAISQTLTNAIIHNRVAHAYLFSGPRGTGKTSSAKLLAKALNCTNIVDGKICDECEDCLLVKSNTHPDVIEIDAASNNGVDEVRDLIEKVKYAPIKGRKKVYIIDEIHMMSQGAFNALLKTLEEPPEHVVFILATTEHHKVLPTIKSRCQKFNFKKLKESDVVDCLHYILKQEECTYDDEALSVIASLCDGGMRDALSFLEQVMIYGNNEITLQNVNESLDLVDQEKVNELYNFIVNQQLDESLSFVNELNKASVDYKQVINDLIKKSMDDLIELKKQHKNVSNQNYLLNMIERLDESLSNLKYDDSKKLYLDLAIIKSINFNQATTPSIEQRVEEAKKLPEDPQEIEEVIVSDHIEKMVEEKVKIVKQMIVTEAELLNVLVQATREDLDFIKSKWSLLEGYLINVNTKKNAGMLIESVPVAACKQALIVVCREASEVALINNAINIEPIAHFINEMMKEPRFCFAINTDDWKKLKDKYLELRTNKQLPEAHDVLENFVLNGSPTKVKEEVSENKLVNFGKELFKDKLIIKREDDYNEY